MTPRQLRAKQALLQALAGHRPQRQNQPQATPAAVLMPLWDDGSEVQVVFTKRTAHLANHAGQVSFPGGSLETGDPDLEFAARRETCEEIGVCDGQVSVVAELDQLLTITNFIITPYVGLLSPEVEFVPNPVEVDKLIIVPLAKVMDSKEYVVTPIEWEGMTMQQEALIHEGEVIWGATGRILRSLLEVLGPQAATVARAGLSSEIQKSLDTLRGLR